MKSFHQVSLVLLLILGINQLGQAQTFTLNDSVVQAGDSLIHDVYFDYNGTGILNESKPFLDSLIVFLQVHDSVQLEVSYHTDYRGNSDYNLRLSKMSGEMIRYYLVYYGKFEEDKVTYVGYGETRLLYKQEEVEKLTTKEEKEEMLAKNRRTVFKIISTSYSTKD